MAVDKRIRTRKINMFEQTHRGFLCRQWMRRTQAVLIDYQHFARFHVSDILRIDEIKRTGFRRNHPGVSQPSQSKRTKPAWVANGYQLGGRQEEHREGAFCLSQDFRYCLAKRSGLRTRHAVQNNLSVGSG